MHAYLKRAQFTISACTSTSENEFQENIIAGDKSPSQKS